MVISIQYVGDIEEEYCTDCGHLFTRIYPATDNIYNYEFIYLYAQPVSQIFVNTNEIQFVRWLQTQNNIQFTIIMV